MATIDRILYPTDGSPGAEVAMDYMLDLASTYDASVDVLHVVEGDAVATRRDAPSGSESPALEKRKAKERVKRLEISGQQLVEEIANQLADENLDAVPIVRKGIPYRTILEYAETAGVDLIVMPTHGRRGIDRYLLGSVTEKVVRSADVPVLTVRLEQADAETETGVRTRARR